MKQLKFILFFLLLAGLHKSQAQETKSLSMTQVDQITYQQYLKGDWDNLIETAEKAKKEGIEFYFLDVRLGIAYYHKKRYRKAIKYLEKAYEKDPKNAVVAEYLYYAYIFGGRYMDAVRMSNDMYLSVKEKIGIPKNKFIDEIGMDFKTEFPEDYRIDLYEGGLDQNVITDNKYLGFNLGNYYGKGNLLWISVGFLSRDYTEYAYDNGLQTIENKNVTQNQYFLAHYSQLSPGLNLGLSFNWLRISYEGVSFRRLGRNGRIIAVPATNTINEFVGFAGLRKDVGDFKIGLTASLSNIQDNLQVQPGLELYFYPLSNTDLYLFSTYNYKMEYIDDIRFDDDVIKAGVGFRLGKVYFEPSYTFGDIYNYVESDGLVVYNDAEKISDRFELMSYGFFFKGRLKLYAKYQNYTKTNYFSLNGEQSEINYNNQTITTGILWKF